MNGLLLDTHVWIWAYEGASALGKKSRCWLTDPDLPRYVSPVSTLEIARLAARGEIILSCPLREWVERSLKDLRLATLPLDHEIAMESYRLPGTFHPDPADRQLVATARIQGHPILTADERILNYAHVSSRDARK